MSKSLKTVQSEEDAVKEDVAKVIHEFEESKKWPSRKSCKCYLMNASVF